ncbi:short-chain dehydrogenase/reductase, partial [Streptomyces sp. NPDC008092]
TIAADGLRKASTHGAYAQQAEAVATSMTSQANTKRMSSPQVIADAIGKAATARKPKTRYATGFGARPMITLRSLLTDRGFDTFISRATGLPRN